MSMGTPSPPPLPPTLPQLLPKKRQQKKTEKKSAAQNPKKKTKKTNENKKAKDTATDSMADAILSEIIPCTKCGEKDDKIAELRSTVEDLQAAICAKKAQIHQLQREALLVPQTGVF